MSSRARVFTWVVIGTCAFCTFDARAAGSAAAQTLFEEGRKAMAAGDLVTACNKLEASQKLEPAAGTSFNLALCYEKAGRSASAWVTFLDAATAYKATNRPDWEAKARERAAALAPTLSKLTIVAPSPAPSDLRVSRDGSVLQSAELGAAIPVDPGRHLVEATASGRTYRGEVELAAGAEKTVTVVLAAQAGSALPEKAPSEPPPAISDTGSGSQKTIGFVLGGVGIASLAASCVTGLLAIGKNSDSTKECPDDGPCPSAAAVRANGEAKDFATVSTITFVAGAALLTAGVVLVLTDKGRPSSAYVAPYVGLGGGGLRGAF